MIIKSKLKEFPITQAGLEVLRKHTKNGFALLCRRGEMSSEEGHYEELPIIKDCKSGDFVFSQLLMPLGFDGEHYNYELVVIVYNHPADNVDAFYRAGTLTEFAMEQCAKHGMKSIYVRESDAYMSKDHKGLYLDAQGSRIEDDFFDACLGFNESDSMEVYADKPWCYTNRVRRSGYGEIFLDVKDQE